MTNENFFKGYKGNEFIISLKTSHTDAIFPPKEQMFSMGMQMNKNIYLKTVSRII